MLGQSYPTDTASKEPQCSLQISLLSKNIEELKAVIMNLSVRLERVLIQEPPQKCSDEKETISSLVPLANQLSIDNREIQLCVQEINSIISRIEL